MNSFENLPSASEEEQHLEAPQPLDSSTRFKVAERQEVDLGHIGQEAINQLGFHLEKPSQPESALSQMLRQFSGVNPYADRLLATLGHDPHMLPSPEPLSEEEKQTEANIAMMIREVGQKTISDTLQEQHHENEPVVADRLRKLPRLLQKGAQCRVSERYDPLGGYFQKITVDTDGTIKQYGQQDCERWAKAVLWQAPGIGELPEVSVSEEDQEDLLQGYVAASLAINPQQEPNPTEIASLLALLGNSKDESSAPIKKRFNDALVYVRTRLTDVASQRSFDESLKSVGMSWQEQKHQYEVTF